ncbi:MAG: lysine-sensitive aspartokinase 3 [Acidobacteria bacterium]|nr:lysine-sensitive aspartokinase 3 [Acidobacteriota bacterium]
MVVQKFGGTSVADPDAVRRLIEIARAPRARDGRGPVVVVSALSGVTDTLLAIAAEAGAARADQALAHVGRLRERHLAMARALAGDGALAALTSQIDAQFDELTAVVCALAVLREVSLRTLDVIAAMGELLSSRIVAAALVHAGLPAEWVDARRAIVTNDDHTRAAPLMRETTAALRALVVPLVADGRVPVLGGFIGATAEGHTTTLGRGGSDYSGAIVGAGIDAGEIQIWTDVDGMLTADPRIIPQPRLVPRLSFAEAAELAYFGAKVLHPSTIHPAVERNIPVRILNSRKPGGAGTLITAEPNPDGHELTAMAAKRDLTVVDITSSRMLMAYGFLRRVFEVFERFRTAVDVVTTSEVSVSVTVDDRRHLDSIVEALSEFAEVSIEGEMALLCAVGDRLRAEPEIAARVVRVLEEMPLRMISQAASRRNITVIMRQTDLPHAMHRLHEEFFG